MKFTVPFTLLGAAVLLALPANAQDENKQPVQPAENPAEPAAETPPPPPAEPEPPKLDPATMRLNSSYGFGFRSGRQFASQISRFGLGADDLDRDRFIAGYFDALDKKDPSITEEDINAALAALQTSIKEREAKLAEKNKADGEAFLAENKKREGVITTASGLQYEIMTKGEGEIYQAPPAGQPANKQFMVKYRGTLIDGTEFDSSKGNSVPMSLNVIPGFKEALTTMPVGSKWKLFIPSELAYKEQRRSETIAPNSTLIFELELEGLKDAPQPEFARPPAGQPGARPQPGAGGRPRAVSPPVRVPVRPEGAQPTKRPGARAVSPPVRIPIPPKTEGTPPAEEKKPEAAPETPAPKEGGE